MFSTTMLGVSCFRLVKLASRVHKAIRFIRGNRYARDCNYNEQISHTATMILDGRRTSRVWPGYDCSSPNLRMPSMRLLAENGWKPHQLASFCLPLEQASDSGPRHMRAVLKPQSSVLIIADRGEVKVVKSCARARSAQVRPKERARLQF